MEVSSLEHNFLSNFKEEVIISLNQGDIIGSNRDGVESFKGIPYGNGPRWSAPTPVEPWSDPYNGLEKYPKCHQDPSGLGKTYEEYYEMVRNGEISENCLFLDIYKPAGVSTEKLPIFVFIHGGGFIAGSSQDFSPEGLAKQGMIVILPQYRLGTVKIPYKNSPYDSFLATLGFLNTFDTNGPTRYGGNWGLLDQKLALEFIHGNAENLGGDQSQITVSGESAGGWSVGNLMQNNDVTKIVKRAISHSGVVLFDMMNQHTENVNNFLRSAFKMSPTYFPELQ